MEQNELNSILRVWAIENHTYPAFIESIPKSELIIGKTYKGHCRNSDEAKWTGERFEYVRCKFGYKYIDKINHFEDDDGYDVFVPIKFKKNL